MGALAPAICGGRVKEADLHCVVEELRLPARFFVELTTHLDAIGVTVVAAEIDEGDDHTGFDRDGLSVFLERVGGHPILTAKEERDLAAIIGVGRLAEQWLASGQVPQDAIPELQRKVRAGEEASNEFVRCNMKLVVSIASKLQRRGVELEDLVQEGYFGLATAIRKFDADLGYKFSTYATWWIRQAVQRAIADRGSTIRLPVHMHERVVRYATVLRRLHQQLERLPTDKELATALEIAPRELTEIQRASRLRPESLDKPFGDRLRAGDMIADQEASSPEDAAVTADICREVRSVLGVLSDRNREVIELRFALADGRVHTLEEISQRFGLTRERIRQIEVKALETLRQPAKARGLREFVERSPTAEGDGRSVGEKGSGVAYFSSVAGDDG
jgi:RNA polymerase primary sigma factor